MPQSQAGYQISLVTTHPEHSSPADLYTNPGPPSQKPRHTGTVVFPVPTGVLKPASARAEFLLWTPVVSLKHPRYGYGKLSV